jgi:WD40 repeat protein
LLRIYTLPKDEPQVIPQHPTKKIAITKCNWLTDNTVLAAGKDGVIRFWDLEKPEAPVATLQVDSEVRDMEISPDETILTVAAGNKVYFFNLETKKLVHAYPMPIHFREVCACPFCWVCVCCLTQIVYLTMPFLLCISTGGWSFVASKQDQVCGGWK